MARTMLVLALSIFAAIILAILLSPLSWAKNTTGGLIGEQSIESSEDAFVYADAAMLEATEIWEEDPSGWEVMHASDSEGGLVVEARQITEGPFAPSGIYLTRARVTFDLSILGRGNHTADSVFEFLVSPEGFAVIDPLSDPEEFSKYVEQFPGWRKDIYGKESAALARLEVADAYINFGKAFAERIFVVLNAIDARERVFASKSVLHKDRPGSSVYLAGSNPLPGDGIEQVRSLNTFGMRVKDFSGTGDRQDNGNIGSIISVEIINWADIRVPSSIQNWINCKLFFPGIFDRLRVALDAK